MRRGRMRQVDCDDRDTHDGSTRRRRGACSPTTTPVTPVTPATTLTMAMTTAVESRPTNKYPNRRKDAREGRTRALLLSLSLVAAASVVTRLLPISSSASSSSAAWGGGVVMLAEAITANPALYSHVHPDGTTARLRQRGTPGRRTVTDQRGYTCIPVDDLPGGVAEGTALDSVATRRRDHHDDDDDDHHDDDKDKDKRKEDDGNVVKGASAVGQGVVSSTAAAGSSRWYMYALPPSPNGDGSLLPSGLRCGVDDPTSHPDLRPGVVPRVLYGDRRQLREGGGSTPGYECGEYCHPNHDPRRNPNRRRTDWIDDMKNRGNNGRHVGGGTWVKDGRGGRRLVRSEDDKDRERRRRELASVEDTGTFERDPYSPELPLHLEEAVPLERMGIDPKDPDAEEMAEEYHLRNGTIAEKKPRMGLGSGGNYDVMGVGGLTAPLAVSNLAQAGQGRRLQQVKTLRNLVICFKFADHANRKVPSTDEISQLMNSKVPNAKAPTGSVGRLFSTNSYGSFNLESVVVGWITLPKNEAYYAAGVSGLGVNMHEAIRAALDLVEEKGIANFADFDVYENGGKGDGVIDCVAFFHSGYPAEFSPDPDCTGQPSGNRIWSHEWSLFTPWFSKKSGTLVQFYPINSAFWGICGSDIARVGVIFHEMAHFLGCPDLYDTRPDEYGFYGFGVGTFGAMGNAWGEDYSQYYPRIMCPWTRFTLGWLAPKVITTSGTYFLKSSYGSPECYIIKSNFPNGEYIVCENMAEVGHSAKGLLCWHIDNAVYDLDNPSNTAPIYNEFDGHPDQPGWPQNKKHYRVAVMGGDGRFQLEKGFNEGDAYDPLSSCWIDEIGPSRPDGKGPHPNTDSYQNGQVKKTGIRIYDVGFPGQNIKFSVNLQATYDDSQKKLIKALMPNFANAMMYEHFTIPGIMFHVFPKSDITLRGIDVHVDFTNTQPCEIWTLQTNQWFNEANRQYDRSAWTKLDEVMVQGRGLHCRTPIDLPTPIEIKGNTIVAIYVTFRSAVMAHSAPDQQFYGQDLGKAIFVEDDMVKMTFGAAKEYPFQGSIPAARPNLVLRYSKGLGALPPTSPPVAAPTLPPFDSSPQTELVTTFQGGDLGAGVMFNVKANRDIELRSISVHLNGSGNREVNVYFNPQGYAGSMSSNNGWNQWCKATVEAKPKGTEVRIPEASCNKLWLTSGQTRGIFVSLPGATDQHYTAGTAEGNVASQNGDAIIYQGVGKGPGGFGGNVHPIRVANVRLFYGHDRTLVTPPQERTGTDKELSSGTSWDNQAGGIMFNVKPKRELRMRTWSVHADKAHSFRVRVYVKPGNFADHVNDASWWGNPVCDATLPGKGTGQLTQIPTGNCSPQDLSGGMTYAVHVDFEKAGGERFMKLQYANAALGSLVASNDDVEMYGGSGKGEDFANTYAGRKFLGALNYTVF